MKDETVTYRDLYHTEKNRNDKYLMELRFFWKLMGEIQCIATFFEQEFFVKTVKEYKKLKDEMKKHEL